MSAGVCGEAVRDACGAGVGLIGIAHSVAAITHNTRHERRTSARNPRLRLLHPRVPCQAAEAARKRKIMEDTTKNGGALSWRRELGFKGLESFARSRDGMGF